MTAPKVDPPTTLAQRMPATAMFSRLMDEHTAVLERLASARRRKWAAVSPDRRAEREAAELDEEQALADWSHQRDVIVWLVASGIRAWAEDAPDGVAAVVAEAVPAVRDLLSFVVRLDAEMRRRVGDLEAATVTLAEGGGW